MTTMALVLYDAGRTPPHRLVGRADTKAVANRGPRRQLVPTPFRTDDVYAPARAGTEVASSQGAMRWG
jgi:hypothetical protein